MSDRRWKEPRAKFDSILAYLDEPQVVLLDHGQDAKIVGVAIELEGFDFPFLGAEVTYDQWQRYLREFVDLRYLFLRPKWRKWYIFDLATEGRDGKIPLARASEKSYKNERFLPSHGFFARHHTEVFDESEAVGRVTQKFGLDGAWDPSDLSSFFGRVNDLYSFFLGIRKVVAGEAPPHHLRSYLKAFVGNTLDSGFNYVNLYGDLRNLLTFEERLAMGSIVKQSPGFVEIEGRGEVLAEVHTAFRTFSENYELLKSQYDDLRGYLSKMGLLKKDGHARFDETGPVARSIDEKSREFATVLGIDYTALGRLTDSNALTTAKLLLAHHRRLARYQLFFVEGRVTSVDVADFEAIAAPSA